jgi:cell division protein ZapA
MKQLEVQIMGQSYLLGCPDGGDARLLEAVQRVDLAMCKIRDSGKVRARDRIAVLAALNLAFDLSDQHALQTGAPAGPPGATPDRDADASRKLAALSKRLDEALNRDDQLF